MAKSAPHIYLSALPFAPTCSLVSAHYSSSFPQILGFKCGQLSHWPPLELVISTGGGGVISVALSPDGQSIVSGSEDGKIRMWNTMTGETVAGPWAGPLLDTQVGSDLWHSHQMASTLSQAQVMKQFVYGMPRQERKQQVHLLGTQVQSGLWPSHQMASTLSQAQRIKQFVCGMPLLERWQ